MGLCVLSCLHRQLVQAQPFDSEELGVSNYVILMRVWYMTLVY
jgi:hypothetical protein